jgi:hypothetical protein
MRKTVFLCIGVRPIGLQREDYIFKIPIKHRNNAQNVSMYRVTLITKGKHLLLLTICLHSVSRVLHPIEQLVCFEDFAYTS